MTVHSERSKSVSFPEVGPSLLLEIGHLGAVEHIGSVGRIIQEAQDIQKG